MFRVNVHIPIKDCYVLTLWQNNIAFEFQIYIFFSCFNYYNCNIYFKRRQYYFQKRDVINIVNSN